MFNGLYFLPLITLKLVICKFKFKIQFVTAKDVNVSACQYRLNLAQLNESYQHLNKQLCSNSYIWLYTNTLVKSVAYLKLFPICGSNIPVKCVSVYRALSSSCDLDLKQNNHDYCPKERTQAAGQKKYLRHLWFKNITSGQAS